MLRRKDLVSLLTSPVNERLAAILPRVDAAMMERLRASAQAAVSATEAPDPSPEFSSVPAQAAVHELSTAAPAPRVCPTSNGSEA